MFFSKNKQSRYKEIEKALILIQKKLLWLKENNDLNTILLAGHDNKSIEQISEKLFQKLTEDHNKSFLLVNLNDTNAKPNELDWDHDLVILYCDNLTSSPSLYNFSKFIDTSIILIEAGCTSRNAIKEMLTTLEDVRVSVCGSILHGFQEKIPSILNRIFN
ncbi:MAG: hypothetical protein NE330_05790 [Lentisphaeraceae bacterium]|nr:hypothetical protein [Lentisphaeraceae bacterium]